MRKTIVEKAISKNDIRDAIMGNDTKHAVEMLEKLGLIKGENPETVIVEEREILAIILGFAAVRAEKGGLDEELAYELIDRIAKKVQIFEFLNFAIAASGAVDPEGYMYIPNKLGEALRENTYYEWINESIKLLDPNVFRILMDYIMNSQEVRKLDNKFCTPIIRYVYEKNIVSHSMVFFMMASSLNQPKYLADNAITGVLHDINDMLGEILGNTLSEETQHHCDGKCDCGKFGCKYHRGGFHA